MVNARLALSTSGTQFLREGDLDLPKLPGGLDGLAEEVRAARVQLQVGDPPGIAVGCRWRGCGAWVVRLCSLDAWRRMEGRCHTRGLTYNLGAAALP